MNERTTEHIRTGLLLGFGMIAGICTMILLAYGFNKLRSPELDNSLFTLLQNYPPRLVGGMCVAIALTILAVTVGRWAKMLSGLFTYGAVGGLLAVAAGGFHSQITALQLTRSGTALMAALFVLCAILTRRLGAGELHIVDRLAALSAPLLLIWAGTSNNAADEFKGVATIAGIFALAAAYNYKGRHRSGGWPGSLR